MSVGEIGFHKARTREVSAAQIRTGEVSTVETGISERTTAKILIAVVKR